MSKTSGGQFVTLDGMRGVGAVLVVMAHAHIFFGNVIMTGGGPALVDTFFILSGFVIAYVYEPRFATGMSARTFMVQRLIRLMPLAMLATVLGYLTLAACVAIFKDDIGQAGMLARLLPEMFLIPAVALGTNDDLFKFNVPLWSLLFELLANAIYILIVPVLTRRVLVATVIFSAILLAILSIAHGTTDGGAELPHGSVGMARAAFGFFAGVLIFRLVGSPTRPPVRTSWLALIPILALIPMAFIPAEGELRPFIQLCIVMGFAPLVVMIGQGIEPPRFMHGFMKWAGELSFAVYVVHWPLLTILRYYEDANPGSLTSLGPMVGVAFLGVVIVVSWLLTKYLEAPLRGWLTQLTRRHRGAAPRTAESHRAPTTASPLKPEGGPPV